MKICYQGFAGTNHSWAIVAQNICRGFKVKNHNVSILSTNGTKNFPVDLKENLTDKLDDIYDIEFSYTAMHNFPKYLQHTKTSKKFGIWAWEFGGKNSLPNGFAKNYKYCTKVIPPSNYVKEIFINSGIPEQNIEVIPHGINYDQIKISQPLNIQTKKSIKICLNVAQPHIRKNLSGSLEAYGKAFTNKDDVCLLLKISDNDTQKPFEVSFKSIFNDFIRKYPNHAEIIILKKFIDNIYDLYRSCDICYSLTHAEGFYMPGLESLACGLINICPMYGGQLDFLNTDNSLLVEGLEINANPKALYYDQKIGTKYFSPNIDDAVDKLRYATKNINNLKKKINTNDVIYKYNWVNIYQNGFYNYVK